MSESPSRAALVALYRFVTPITAIAATVTKSGQSN